VWTTRVTSFKPTLTTRNVWNQSQKFLHQHTDGDNRYSGSILSDEMNLIEEKKSYEVTIEQLMTQFQRDPFGFVTLYVNQSAPMRPGDEWWEFTVFRRKTEKDTTGDSKEWLEFAYKPAPAALLPDDAPAPPVLYSLRGITKITISRDALEISVEKVVVASNHGNDIREHVNATVLFYTIPKKKAWEDSPNTN
jgi:hypothetical protein